jgi:hypothetical protein
MVHTHAHTEKADVTRRRPYASRTTQIQTHKQTDRRTRTKYRYYTYAPMRASAMGVANTESQRRPGGLAERTSTLLTDLMTLRDSRALSSLVACACCRLRRVRISLVQMPGATHTAVSTDCRNGVAAHVKSEAMEPCVSFKGYVCVCVFVCVAECRWALDYAVGRTLVAALADDLVHDLLVLGQRRQPETAMLHQNQAGTDRILPRQTHTQTHAHAHIHIHTHTYSLCRRGPKRTRSHRRYHKKRPLLSVYLLAVKGTRSPYKVHHTELTHTHALSLSLCMSPVECTA